MVGSLEVNLEREGARLSHKPVKAKIVAEYPTRKDARHKFPLEIDFRIGNIGRKIGNMSENNYPTYFGNLL